MTARSSITVVRAISEALLQQSSRCSARINPKTSWICQSCRTKSSSSRPKKSSLEYSYSTFKNTRIQLIRHGGLRSFSSARKLQQDPSNVGSNGHELPSKQDSRRSKAEKQLSHMMDNIQTNIFFAGKRLNDLTGYSAIEALKNEIQKLEELVQTTREQLRQAKDNYTQAINQRSQSQREVNELLQRKHAWSPQDLERFTSLYRSDHANEQAESEAQQAVTQAEHAAEEAAAKLNANILARYHEEQIWSDKIRRMSTWGTWGLMGVNVLLFLVFQIGVEPWRRRRLVKGFEDKVVEALEKETAMQRSIAVEAATRSAAPAVSIKEAIEEGTVPATNSPEEVLLAVQQAEQDQASPVMAKPTLLPAGLPDNWTWKDNWRDVAIVYVSKLKQLFGDQQVELRQVDVTTKFIEGALSSAVMISLAAAIFRPR